MTEIIKGLIETEDSGNGEKSLEVTNYSDEIRLKVVHTLRCSLDSTFEKVISRVDSFMSGKHEKNSELRDNILDMILAVLTSINEGLANKINDNRPANEIIELILADRYMIFTLKKMGIDPNDEKIMNTIVENIPNLLK
ncbi:hypothetical protein EOM39_00450 [Candidatus Gracilibacteria bacterium]|nr:hypothetical protein [Candidatus Gracilibacteria bacterium]